MGRLPTLFLLLCFAAAVAASGDLHTCPTDIACYDELQLGCFPTGEATPFCLLAKLPLSPREINPTLYLSTSPRHTRTLKYDADLLERVARLEMDSERPLYVLIHGFLGDWPRPWLPAMQTALLNKGFNVLVVRWTDGSGFADHRQASANTRVVGAVLARVLQTLADAGQLRLHTSTLVGMSLGAHVAGFAGKALGGRLGHIIGLDPAGSLFRGAEPAARLARGDAEKVQCVHTDGGGAEGSYLGYGEPLCDVDFFANGGARQPGCDDGNNLVDSENAFSAFCSHFRAAYLLTSTIQSDACEYRAFPCDSAERFGSGQCFRCPPNGCPTFNYEFRPVSDMVDGSYYFNTLAGTNARLEPRFCGVQYRIEITGDTSAHVTAFLYLMKYRMRSEQVRRTLTFEPDQSTKTIFLTAVPLLDRPTHLNLRFRTKNKGMSTWRIDRIVVTRQDGQRFRTKEGAMLTTGKTFQRFRLFD